MPAACPLWSRAQATIDGPNHLPARRAPAAIGAMRPPAYALLLVTACGAPSPGAPPPPASLRHTVTTSHFVVHTDLPPAERDFHVRLLGAFRAWFAHRYYEPAAADPLATYLFSTTAEFAAFGRRIGGPDSSGYFAELDNGTPVLVADLSSGLGTLLHELVHAFVHQGFRPVPPLWFNEGFAAYHEKALGQLDGTRLDASFGYLSNWRFPRLQAEAAAGRVKLANLVDRTHDPTTAAASLMLFLDRHDRFVPLVRAMRSRSEDADGMRTLAAVWGADLADLEGRWLAWIHDQRPDEVALVPRTTILRPAEWNAWVEAQVGARRWDGAAGRWQPVPAPR